MLDLIVGIVIVCFAILGIREGIAKSLGSVVLIFVAVFLATGAVNLLAQNNPEFNDPNYLAATVIFLFVWLISFILLDLLLLIILKRIVTIVILGPFDKVGGVLIGGFKGALICGIVLQLVLYFPISSGSKEKIRKATLSRFSMATYNWAYSLAAKAAPGIRGFMIKSLEERTGEMEKMKEEAEKLKKEGTGEFMEKISKYREVQEDKEEKARQLLKDKRLLPVVPR
jgi:uncharacterized membrane protein required for colicin V production